LFEDVDIGVGLERLAISLRKYYSMIGTTVISDGSLGEIHISPAERSDIISYALDGINPYPFQITFPGNKIHFTTHRQSEVWMRPTLDPDLAIYPSYKGKRSRKLAGHWATSSGQVGKPSRDKVHKPQEGRRRLREMPRPPAVKTPKGASRASGSPIGSGPSPGEEEPG
jgi:hypothetical protein